MGKRYRVIAKPKVQSNTPIVGSSEKEKYLQAFNDLLPELDDVRDEIFKIINEFLKNFYDEQKKDHEVDFVLFEPTSRVKGKRSFEEKIVRKNYVKLWTVYNNDYANTILNELDDIIGFRINCYFKKDEPNIYLDVINYLENNPLFTIKEYGSKSGEKIKELSNIEKLINTQANGEPIYKMVWEYKSPSHQNRTYPFELQIKSLIHNLWGEVDHEIAYKAKQYDYNFEQKKIITKAIFETLKASDTQLFNLYRTNYEEMNLINSLFFLYTSKDVENALNGKNPTFYYHKFFSLFDDNITISLIKKYVSLKMVGAKNFEKQCFITNCKEEKLKVLFKKLLEENELYDFNRCNEIKEIANILYKIESPSSSFVDYIYPLLRQKIKETSIVNENPEESQEDDDDDVSFNEMDKEINITSLEVIFKDDLQKPGKKAFYDIVKNRRDCNPYEKEILCRVFFDLFDI